jgi:hypothetical protein
MDPMTIGGNANLSQQEATLNFTENAASVRTVSYAIANPAASHLNEATFANVPQTQILPPLKLVPEANVPAGTEPDFVDDIWVSGVVRKIAGIR